MNRRSLFRNVAGAFGVVSTQFQIESTVAEQVENVETNQQEHVDSMLAPVDVIYDSIPYGYQELLMEVVALDPMRRGCYAKCIDYPGYPIQEFDEVWFRRAGINYHVGMQFVCPGDVVGNVNGQLAYRHDADGNIQPLRLTISN